MLRAGWQKNCRLEGGKLEGKFSEMYRIMERWVN
jgi:hypothetical protein